MLDHYASINADFATVAVPIVGEAEGCQWVEYPRYRLITSPVLSFIHQHGGQKHRPAEQDAGVTTA